MKSLEISVELNQLNKIFTATVEQDSDTNLYVGYVSGFVGAHSQAETLDELQENLSEVIQMLLEEEELIKTELVSKEQMILR